MNARLTRLAAALGFSGALVLSTASCSVLPRTAGDQTAGDQGAPSVAIRAAPLRVVQMNFGRDAYFAGCAEPVCPGVTQKTLSRTGAQQPVALVRPAIELPVVVEPPPTPQPVPPSKPIHLKEEEVHIHVTFPFGSAALSDAAKETLRRALPNARESDHVVISGRTDNVGSEEVNQKLAQARAFAVRNYIRDAAPDLPDVIDIDAKGRCCFIAPNDSEEGRSKNRRVEVVFISKRVM